MPIARQHVTLDLARKTGRVSVDELAARFEVTPQTIRKDLNGLRDRRMPARVHGGALLVSGVENVGYEARHQIARAETPAIGRAAAALVPNDVSPFVNIQSILERSGLRFAGRKCNKTRS